MIKNFILNLKFVKEALREAEIKAFPKAQKDILETMRDDLDKQAEELAKGKLQELLSPIDWTHVVKFNSVTKIIYIGDRQAEPERLANLKAEAQFFAESDLWRLMYETPKTEAQNSMFVKGESIDDMRKGRTMLFTLSQQGNIIDTFRNYVPKLST